MRIVILTSSRQGTASRCLPALCKNSNIEVIKIVLAEGGTPNRKRAIKRKLLKTLKIGVFGALNGVRLRQWYQDENSGDILSIAQQYNVPLVTTPSVNSEETKHAFRESRADLGLSLGNSYISESVFTIPKFGMINIHGEILPDFQGAQGIIWPIFEARDETGFTIHQIDKHIDTGNILFQQKHPIIFCSTLRETVEKTSEHVRNQIPDALAWVCQHYEELKEDAKPQGKGKAYTTPTIKQFFRMLRNHKTMYEKPKK